MNIKDFKSQINIISNDEANIIRKQFIARFINVNSSHYKKYIKKLEKYVDGYCYEGYLWDCLKESYVIDEKYIDDKANGFNDVYIMWDINTCEKIYIEDYWKFGKIDILNGDMNVLLEGEVFLPEDYYIFDKEMQWCLIKTHEDIDGCRYCLKSGNI